MCGKESLWRKGSTGKSDEAEEYMKVVAADSSSIILLQKTALLDHFWGAYRVVIAASVYGEVTSHRKTGVAELAALLRTSVREPCFDGVEGNMGDGERDTLSLYREGYGDFILVDDKKAAQYCRKKGIPFVNGLLVPRLLLGGKLISRDACRLYTARLAQQGYYSETIIRRASALRNDDLEVFFPA
jgi:predicted nucleic acid-binding protein